LAGDCSNIKRACFSKRHILIQTRFPGKTCIGSEVSIPCIAAVREWRRETDKTQDGGWPRGGLLVTSVWAVIKYMPALQVTLCCALESGCFPYWGNSYLMPVASISGSTHTHMTQQASPPFSCRPSREEGDDAQRQPEELAADGDDAASRGVAG
jgi:hypothetical protein